MSPRQAFQSGTAPLEQPAGAEHVSDRDFEFRGPWLTSRQATNYIPCKNVRAFYQWRRRHGVVSRANGSVAKADLDRVLARRTRWRVAATSLANLKRG